MGLVPVSRSKLLYYMAKMAGVGAMQVVILLCGSVLQQFPLIARYRLCGDVVFFVATILAFGGYYYFTWFDLPRSRGLACKVILTSVIGLLAMVLSTVCFIIIAVNIWGE
jgi:hypothetical protein